MADLDIQSGQGPAGNKERWADLTGGVYARVVSAVLAAGTAILGKVGIDQTTPGTTDSVTVSTAQGAGAAIGTTSGAAVITDANGTIPQYLRGIVTYLVTAAGGAVANVAAATGFLRALGIRQYLATPPTLTDTRYQHGLADINGADQTNLATLLAGENQTLNRMMVAQSYSFANITTATTTTVKSGAGIVARITFNKFVANEVYTVYDNTAGSGTKLGTFTAPAVLLANHFVWELGAAFATGLTIVSAQASDVTVVYI